MLRRRTFCLMLMAVLVLPLWANQQNTADDKQKHSGITPPPPSGAAGVTAAQVNDTSARNNQYPSPNKSPGRPPLWDSYWPNLALSFFSLLAAGIALKTLTSIRDQVKIAKNSVGILMTSERAWLVGKAEPLENWLKDDFPPPPRLDVICGVGNFGKTVAKVIEKGESFSVQTSITDLPVNPMYTYTVKWGNGVLVAPNSWLSRPLYTTSGDGLRAVIIGSQLLFVFGFVRYIDTFGSVHTTRYLVQYDPKMRAFYPQDKEHYNEAT